MRRAHLLSIVIPAYDEAPGIADALAALQPLRAAAIELIVVDGGSTDATVMLATPLVDRLVRAPRGRGTQMNAGAAVASGEILLFLHADCALPAAAAAMIIDGLAASGKCWGRFDIRLAGRHPLLPVVAAMINLRSRLTGIATGDQGIFVTRECFARVGGYAAMPLMEDIELCSRLKTLGRPLCLAARINASGRRWERHGVLRTIVLMWRLRLAYFCGVEPAALARQYGYAPRGEATIAVFAKAPEPGTAKTRLIPLLGAAGAAALQARLIERALATAADAALGPVTLWCTPTAEDPLLVSAATAAGAGRARQCEGDLGARMFAATAAALADFSHVIIIGTDCPALTPAQLRETAAALADHDAVLVPAEDGGYVLIGMRRADARVFAGIEWGSATVMAATRRNLAALGWRWRELAPSWDVDRPADFARLCASGLMPGLDQLKPAKSA
jgi:rSAM/selenodomain-associated transferase 2/rSAM/selenodomain-associated transferase 1